MQDKYQYDEKGERHGYWERYRTQGGKLWYICNYVNGVWYGYFEHHRLPKITKEYNAR